MRPLTLRIAPRRAAITILAATLLSGGAGARAQERDSGYGIRPGDRVTIDFFTAAGDRLSVIAGSRTVDREGNIYLPYVATVGVVGMDASDIRGELEELYGGFYLNPVIDVTVELRVNVTGAVRVPGNYYVSPSSTIIDVLSLAGGVGMDVAVTYTTVPADPSRVRLVRDGETSILDVRPDQASEEVLSMLVQSGDWLYVPPRPRSRVREEIQFWGSVVSLLGSVIAIGVLLTR